MMLLPENSDLHVEMLIEFVLESVLRSIICNDNRSCRMSSVSARLTRFDGSTEKGEKVDYS